MYILIKFQIKLQNKTPKNTFKNYTIYNIKIYTTNLTNEF